MALVRYEPWNLVNQLHEELNRAFKDWTAGDTSAATADWIPPADVEEYADRFEVFVDLPGVAASEVDITLEKGVLTLSGERKPQRNGEVLHRRSERGHGRFYRRFILPQTVNADAVEARETNGVLAITIPKQAAAMPRRIPVAA